MVNKYRKSRSVYINSNLYTLRWINSFCFKKLIILKKKTLGTKYYVTKFIGSDKIEWGIIL